MYIRWRMRVATARQDFNGRDHYSRRVWHRQIIRADQQPSATPATINRHKQPRSPMIQPTRVRTFSSGYSPTPRHPPSDISRVFHSGDSGIVELNNKLAAVNFFFIKAGSQHFVYILSPCHVISYFRSNSRFQLVIYHAEHGVMDTCSVGTQ